MNLLPANFRTSELELRFDEVHSKLKEIAYDMCNWCKGCDLPFVITGAKSTAQEDLELNRRSKTHSEGRAFDMTRQGWSQAQIEEFAAHFTAKYEDVASLNIGGFPNLIVHHNVGLGDHLHVQIRRGLPDVRS